MLHTAHEEIADLDFNFLQTSPVTPAMRVQVDGRIGMQNSLTGVHTLYSPLLSGIWTHSCGASGIDSNCTARTMISQC